MSHPASNGPLAGCRVVETGRFITGPYAAQLLADLGAEVIKIEDPEGGDPFRGWGRHGWNGYGPPFVAFNRNKRSIALDLKLEPSRKVARRLVQKADVFIENYRPGVAEKLGLGYAALAAQNPRLIYCSISGLGQDGPYAQRPCYDIVGQGLSGLLSQLVDLDDPRPVGPAFSDALTGVFAAYGILAALQGRERTGRGQRVDTSLLQSTMAFLNEPYAALFSNGRSPDAFDRPRMSAVFTFLCSDRLAIAIHLSSPPKFWRAFVTAVGHPEMIDDERFQTHTLRVRHWNEINACLVPVFSTRPRSEWLELLDQADVPCAPIYRLDEAVGDPQVRHMEMVRSIAHPGKGDVQVLGFPVKLSDTPLELRSAPPTLGEHTNEILSEAGFSDAEIQELRSCGVL